MKLSVDLGVLCHYIVTKAGIFKVIYFQNMSTNIVGKQKVPPYPPPQDFKNDPILGEKSKKNAERQGQSTTSDYVSYRDRSESNFSQIIHIILLIGLHYYI